MKLDWDMNQLDTFHLHKNGGGSEWAGWGRIQKTIKKCQEINKIPTLTSPKNSLQNAIKARIFLLSSLTIWLYCWQGLKMKMGGGGGGRGGWTGGASY